MFQGQIEISKHFLFPALITAQFHAREDEAVVFCFTAKKFGEL
jgi:hypothetical protein